MHQILDSVHLHHSEDTPPQAHFRLHIRLLMARMLHNLNEKINPDEHSKLQERFPLIASYAPLAADEIDHDIHLFEAGYAGHLPIRALRQDLDISEASLYFLLASGLVEEDIQIGALFANLQTPLNSRYPCIGLLSWLLSDTEGMPADGWAISQELARHGLVTVKQDDDTPHLEWALRVPLVLWMALRGQTAPNPTENIQRYEAHTFPNIDELILAEDYRQQIQKLPIMLQRNDIPALVLRGMVGTGRRTIIGSVARELGRDILVLEKTEATDLNPLGALATLTNAIPVIRLDANPGETITLNLLPGYRRVVGITMGRTGGIAGKLMDSVLTVTLPAPNYQERAHFWQRTDHPIDSEHLEPIVEQFLLTGGRIHGVARQATVQMEIAGRSRVTIDDVQGAVRTMNRQELETLATPLTPISDWDSLIVNSQITESLRMLQVRCRMREHLLEHTGAAFEDNLNRGVRALFAGPSGTGKTFAVRALAGALNMDVYRVDLAGIVNKYIGETEKNLNRVFTYAEELDILLLLDEGDSLMTTRTDVKGANDRYANLETNFLLQRLESYEGIIVVTTNAAQRIDQAFIRRLDVVIDFTRPDVAERRLLWMIHLPADHNLNAAFFEHIVQRCELTGGQIRNVALNASLLALDDRRLIEDEHLDYALRREYHKASLPYPLATRR